MVKKENRKKIVAFLLLFTAITSSFSGCFAAISREDSPFIGKWFLTSASMGDEEASVVGTGLEMSFSISSDLIIAHMKHGDEEYTEEVTNFQQSGSNLVVFMEYDGMTVFHLDDETHMSCEMEDFKLLFEKGWNATDAMPVRATSVKEEQFFGKWEASHAIVEGLKVPMSTLGAAISLDIRSGKAVFQLSSSVANVEAKMEADTILSSDVLVVSMPGITFVVCLYEDGTASFELEGSTVILTK